MGERRTVYRLPVGKQEGKKSLRRPRCSWVDNIKMDLEETMEMWTGFVCLRVGEIGELF
jgi:hypothetical protein